MKIKMRNAFGMGQIIATLLVVLPTMAFVTTLLVDYWAVMQADYKLKIIANQISTFADSREDLRNFTTPDGSLASDFTQLLQSINPLCPAGKTIAFGAITDAPKGAVNITVNYTYNGPYFKNKLLTTSMSTYSYRDANITVTATCQ